MPSRKTRKQQPKKPRRRLKHIKIVVDPEEKIHAHCRNLSLGRNLLEDNETGLLCAEASWTECRDSKKGEKCSYRGEISIYQEEGNELVFPFSIKKKEQDAVHVDQKPQQQSLLAEVKIDFDKLGPNGRVLMEKSEAGAFIFDNQGFSGGAFHLYPDFDISEQRSPIETVNVMSMEPLEKRVACSRRSSTTNFEIPPPPLLAAAAAANESND